MDKNGVALAAWPALGFGFVEVGTVTWHDQPGNDRPRVFRLRASQAVMILLRLFRALERVDTGLTPQQYRILKLAGAGGERSAKLAERLAVAKPTLTATADGLVAAGYARRDAEPGDRRVVRLCLTTAGHDAVRRAEAAYARWLDQLLAATGHEDEVLHALDELNQAMDEVRRTRLAASGCAEPDRSPERAGTA